jgi:hypothetical protein
MIAMETSYRAITRQNISLKEANQDFERRINQVRDEFEVTKMIYVF